MESQVYLGGKEGHTNVQISAEPGIELGTLWMNGSGLSDCANHSHPTTNKWGLVGTAKPVYHQGGSGSVPSQTNNQGLKIIEESRVRGRTVYLLVERQRSYQLHQP